MRKYAAVGMLLWAGLAAAQRPSGQIATPALVSPPVLTGLASTPDPLAARMTSDIATAFSPDAYPPEAVRLHQQGRVVARLAIDAEGRVTSCFVAQSSGSPSLDEHTCSIAQTRLTFSPAHDKHGRSIASTYTLPVRWSLPTGQPGGPGSFMPLESFAAMIEEVVGADGQRRSCVFRVNGQEVQESQPCAVGGPQEVGTALAMLPANMKGHPFVLFSESRQDYVGEPAAPISGETDLVRLQHVETRFTIDTAGKASGCEVEGDGDLAALLAQSPCASPFPFRYKDSRPIARPIAARWTATLSVRALPEGGGV